MRFIRPLSLIPALALFLQFTGAAAIPNAERLLPEDTLVMVTTPDCSRLQEVWKKQPQAQLWNDPAMKPFRQKLVAKWNEDFLTPLERELDIKLATYTGVLQGQLTIALILNAQTESQNALGTVVLLDTKDKSNQLKTNLAALRKKWADAGKAIRTEKVRDIEFTILPLSTNDVPKTLRKFFPPASPVQELGDEPVETVVKKIGTSNELLLGQSDSLLILGNSIKAVESVVVRLRGGTATTLAESGAYQAAHNSMFRDAPAYGWVNAKALMDLVVKKAAEKKENPDAPNPFDFKPEKILSALGLTALKSFAFSLHGTSEGCSFEAFAGVPEASRQGVFKILAGEAKETMPPPFVPAEAIKFQRWRMDGQKAWATLEKTLGDISPQALSGINFLLETANAAAKDKDPGFDIKKNLIGNLGNDLVTYEKAPRGNSPAALETPPSLFLLGSPNAEQLAAALKSVLVYMSMQAGTPPEEREFLGRKIYSVPMRPMGMGGSSSGNSSRTLNYAASGGYVAISTEASMLEEYLRSSDATGKSLKDIPGLSEAAQKVTGPGCSLFGYENQVETTRAFFEALRKDAGAMTNSATAMAASLVPGALGFQGASQNFKDWLDFSLLPPFEQISKYFYMTVYGGSATVDGLTVKLFAPTPPNLRAAAAK